MQHCCQRHIFPEAREDPKVEPPILDSDHRAPKVDLLVGAAQGPGFLMKVTFIFRQSQAICAIVRRLAVGASEFLVGVHINTRISHSGSKAPFSGGCQKQCAVGSLCLHGLEGSYLFQSNILLLPGPQKYEKLEPSGLFVDGLNNCFTYF